MPLSSTLSPSTPQKSSNWLAIGNAMVSKDGGAEDAGDVARRGATTPSVAAVTSERR